ncbi:MAG: hypothetical protein NTV05_08135 [Acidobacteria bacterium]|nr:hypothetical protein [Acidobacteriota bacterium]
MNTITDVLLQVINVLDELDVEYVLVGSVASSARGFPRSTNDADIVADLRPEHTDRLVASLGGEFYIDPGAVARAVVGHRSFNAIHHASGFKVDVFVPPPDGFGRQQLARRSQEHLDPAGPQAVFVATAEDVVLSKLDWYRASDGMSDRQWHDLVGVIKVQAPTIDLAYLRQWAARLGLTELLDRALAEAAEFG